MLSCDHVIAFILVSRCNSSQGKIVIPPAIVAAVQVIVSLVAGPLSRHPRMSQQDSSTVQLVLSFFRNLLEVPDELLQPGCAVGDGSRQLQVR